MTFLDLQREIVQTRKARRGVKNRTDYFGDDWQNEKFWREVYKRALRVANEIVQHYEEAGELNKSEKIGAWFGAKSKDSTKELKKYQEEVRRLSSELDSVKRELARAKRGGRRRDRAKEQAVIEYKKAIPGASVREIARKLSISTTTVQKALVEHGLNNGSK